MPSARPAVLLSDPAGYRLDVEIEQVDFRRFEVLADEGAALLDADDSLGAQRVLREGLALWRGPALAEFADREFALGPAIRLEERRMVALEHRIEADLRQLQHAALVGELGELVADHPLREGLRAHLALALYRSGRQAEALRSIDDARATLREQLGVDPGRALRDLEAAILAQDPSLDAPAVDDAGRSGSSAPAERQDAADVEPPPPQPRASDPTVEPRVTAGPPAAGTGLVGRTDELVTLTRALDTLDRASADGDRRGRARHRQDPAARGAATAWPRRSGATVTWGRSFEGGAAPAFWPWLSAWRSLLGRAVDVTDAVPPQLGLLLDPDTTVVPPPPSGAARFELFEGVAVPARTTVAGRNRWSSSSTICSGPMPRRSSCSRSSPVDITEPGVLIVAALRERAFGRSDNVVEALAAVARRSDTVRLQLDGLDADETARLLEVTTRREVPAAVAPRHPRSGRRQSLLRDRAGAAARDRNRRRRRLRPPRRRSRRTCAMSCAGGWFSCRRPPSSCSSSPR